MWSAAPANERIEWRLRHGDVATLDITYPRLKLLVTTAAGLATNTAKNAVALANYIVNLYNYGRISTAFVKSTVNVVCRRFPRKQQMQWSKQGAHRVLQTRTRTLDGKPRALFTRWHPAMAANKIALSAGCGPISYHALTCSCAPVPFAIP